MVDAVLESLRWSLSRPVVQASLAGLALAVAGVLVLRRTQPSLERPYRVPGYPVVPLVFIVGTAWIVGSALIAQPAPTLAGIGLTLLGAPVYWLRRRAARSHP